MRWSMRSLFVECVALALTRGAMSARAVAALSVSWERNWGELDATAPYTDGSFFSLTDVAVDKWGMCMWPADSAVTIANRCSLPMACS